MVKKQIRTVRKFNKQIKIELRERVRCEINNALCDLLHPEVTDMSDDEESMKLASILVDVQRKLNKPVAHQARKSHKFTLKYHEASALKEAEIIKAFLGLPAYKKHCAKHQHPPKYLIRYLNKRIYNDFL